MSNHGLMPHQIETIGKLLAPYGDRIERVALFGSRATGRYRANSDIDMVLYGPVDQKLVNHLHTIFIESNLPLKADIVAYDLITHPPLKTHIDEVAKTMLTQEDFKRTSNDSIQA